MFGMVGLGLVGSEICGGVIQPELLLVSGGNECRVETKPVCTLWDPALYSGLGGKVHCGKYLGI